MNSYSDEIQALHRPQTDGLVRLPVGQVMNDPFEGSRLLADMPLHRYYWRLFYGPSRQRFQYEIVGGNIIQSMFGKLDKTGVTEIWVADVFRSPDDALLKIKVPEGATPDILCHVAMSLTCSEPQNYRIFTFGWKSEKDSEYHHLFPAFDPPFYKKSKLRGLSWSDVPKAQGSDY
jgi:hypothetical protein